jgi:flagellar basal-body rod protein FlgB
MADGTSVIQQLQGGLQAVSLRQKLIANNIANIETPGFRRQDVDFKKVLSAAIKDGRGIDAHDVEASIIEPGNTAVGENGNDVSLDTEVGELVKNSAAYKTYIRLLNKMYKQMEVAMSTE